MGDPYEPDNFTVLGLDDPPSDDKPTGCKPFGLGSQEAVNLLESIMPAEKGQAVPYVLIWEIDAATGKAQHANSDGSPKRPLSIIYVEPPKFGTSVSDPNMKFRERPPVSLERVIVKTENPRGIILYRRIEIHFTVHRPEIVFEHHIDDVGGKSVHITDPDQDSWSSLVTPGEAFALEYGWSASKGVKNGLLNGTGFVDRDKGVAITGREQVRFYVTNYKFQIQSNNEIKFQIFGMEMGESGLRQAYLVKQPQNGGEPPPPKSAQKLRHKQNVDPYGAAAGPITELLKKVQDRIGGSDDAKKSSKKKVVSVPFGVLIDVLFYDVIKKSFADVGFEFKDFFVGCLNKRAGKPAMKYSGGSDVSGNPISDFTFPMDDIEGVFKKLMKAGAELTVYNFMEPFLRLFSDPAIWDRKGEPNDSKRTIPQIITRTISRRNTEGKIEVFYYIFDATTEFTKLTNDDAKKLPDQTVSRSDIKKLVNDKGIPYVSLVKANSFIQSSNFDTIQNEDMASIFQRRYFGDKSLNRDQKVTQPGAAQKEDRSPAVQQIFSPVIQGNITMIGNFIFDTFGLIWLDFGVARWDGPFQLDAREDVIEKGSFLTTMRIHSTGTDPLGTKSRKNVV